MSATKEWVCNCGFTGNIDQFEVVETEHVIRKLGKVVELRCPSCKKPVKQNKLVNNLVCSVSYCTKNAVGRAWWEARKKWYIYCHKHLEDCEKIGHPIKPLSDTGWVGGSLIFMPNKKGDKQK